MQLVALALLANAATRDQRCDSPANKIVRENCLQGAPSTEWDVNGAGDPSIQGFAEEFSITLGETAHFKVKTDATAYRIDIYRLGYYDGLGARLVGTVLPSAKLPQKQPECLSEMSTLLVDCVNWQRSASWESSVDGTSGIYLARLVRTDEESKPNWRADNSPLLGDPKFGRDGIDQTIAPETSLEVGAYGFMRQHLPAHGAQRNAIKEGRASHIYFLVRDDKTPSDVLMQTMDTTWQAYNCWGSTNAYSIPCNDPLTHAGSPAPLNSTWRAYKLSYNRPFATRAYRASNMPFNSEYPMIRWLERNGYDVSYWSGADTDRRSLVDERTKERRFKLFLSVGHDEYWSGRQRQHVAEARDAGMNLCFFSGNEMYWRVRWENELATDPTGEGVGHGERNSHRTLVVYKDTQSLVPIDPVEWTGTWRDARPIRGQGEKAKRAEALQSLGALEALPENEMTGTIFGVNAWRNDALEVPAPYGTHRFWRHTSVAKLADASIAAANKATGMAAFASSAGATDKQKVVLVKGILGHEWDEDIDNGYRPPGLMHLSSTTIDGVQYLMDEGAAFDTATATHHLTLYRHYSASTSSGAVPAARKGAAGANMRVTQPQSPGAAGGDTAKGQCAEDDGGQSVAFRRLRWAADGLSESIHTYLKGLGTSDTSTASTASDTSDTSDAPSETNLAAMVRGGLVFGAGTCQWSWGLDGHHDLVNGMDLQMGKNVYSLRVDVDQFHPDGNLDIQQATMNLFDDMEVRPPLSSLQQGLVLDHPQPLDPTDVEAPEISPVLLLSVSRNSDDDDNGNGGSGSGGVFLAEKCTAKGYVSGECGAIAGASPTVSASGNRLLIEGRAWDVGGGIVGAVEVSEDGGKTWHPTLAQLPTPGVSFKGEWHYYRPHCAFLVQGCEGGSAEDGATAPAATVHWWYLVRDPLVQQLATASLSRVHGGSSASVSSAACAAPALEVLVRAVDDNGNMAIRAGQVR
jgi:hypothetical protein